MPVRRVAPFLLLAVLLAACAGPSPSVPPPSLDAPPEDVAMRQFSDAMSRAVDAPRAERDGTHLVITSPTCVIRIPVTERATPDVFLRPIEGSPSRLDIAAIDTGVYCTDIAPSYRDLSVFTFSSVADRDRAVETGRNLLRAWPRDAFAPEPASLGPGPATSGGGPEGGPYLLTPNEADRLVAAIDHLLATGAPDFEQYRGEFLEATPNATFWEGTFFPDGVDGLRSANTNCSDRVCGYSFFISGGLDKDEASLLADRFAATHPDWTKEFTVERTGGSTFSSCGSVNRSLRIDRIYVRVTVYTSLFVPDYCQ